MKFFGVRLLNVGIELHAFSNLFITLRLLFRSGNDSCFLCCVHNNHTSAFTRKNCM